MRLSHSITSLVVERLLVICSSGSCEVLAGPEGGAEQVQALVTDAQIEIRAWFTINVEAWVSGT